MISSRQNAKLKDIRRLRRCKGDRALLDGPKLIVEALSANLQLEAILATSEFVESTAGRRLLPQLPHPPLLVASPLFRELVDSETPQGILAVINLARPSLTDLVHPEEAIYLYLDGLQDPGNLGAIARVAEASGVQAVFASATSVSPNHPRALRASAGSLLRLPWVPQVGAEAVRDWLGSATRWVTLEIGGGTSLYELMPARSTVLVVGSEGRGVSSSVRSLCDQSVEIPMCSPVESLNAATATAVVLFELRRRSLTDRMTEGMTEGIAETSPG